MAVQSAGLLLYRRVGPVTSRDTSGDRSGIEVLLGHMGGPFWARRDVGAWSIPKGLVDDDDIDLLATARREFVEEMGQPVPKGDAVALGAFAQNRSKTIHVWALEADLDADACVGNLFELEWPPRSGRFEWFPEIDRAEWFDVDAASTRIVAGQRQVLDSLCLALDPSP